MILTTCCLFFLDPSPEKHFVVSVVVMHVCCCINFIFIFLNTAKNKLIDVKFQSFRLCFGKI